MGLRHSAGGNRPTPPEILDSKGAGINHISTTYQLLFSIVKWDSNPGLKW